MNHETSRVPFPTTRPAPTAANGENDFDNAQVSRLIVNQQSGGVLNGSFVDPEQRGLPALLLELPRDREGGLRPGDPLHERGGDRLRPPATGLLAAGDRRPGREAGRPRRRPRRSDRQAPADPRHGTAQPRELRRHPGLRGPGRAVGRRHVHERSADHPPGGPVTGSSRAAQSQLYSYLAEDTDSLLADEGDLWAFVSDDAGFNDYYDFTPGSTASVSGHFVKVPKNIATGLDTDGSELKAADVGFPLPPNDGSWQRDNRTTVPTGLDGPQWVLEYWSQLQRRLPVRPGRGRRLRQAARHGERRLRRRLRARHRRSVAGRTLDERPRVEDGARRGRPDRRGIALRGRRRRRQRGQDPRRDPPARQHRVDALGPARDGGSGLEPAVHGGAADLGCRPRDHCAAVVGAVLGLASGRGEGRPVGRRRPDGRRRTPRRQLGRVGDERHRRRVGGLRPRLVPDRRAGELTLGREGSG